MMLRCPSCGVRLRLKDETAATRSAAKCPQCSATVPLNAVDGAVIKVQCGSCGVRLKAPAGSEGTRSACPRCKAEVTIGSSTMAQPAPLAARPHHDESSGVSTRRIDSRSLGMPSLGASGAPAGDIDLDAFVRSKEHQAIGREDLERFDGPDLATSLMKPPVKELERLAGEIRLAAASFDPAAARTANAVAEVPEPRPMSARESQAPRAYRPAPTTSSVPSSQTTRTFPASRGLMLGTIAGLLVGGISAAATKLAGPAALNYIAPLPMAGNAGGLPDVTLQVALPALLAAIAGFIAAAAGSPSLQDRPLRLLRTLGFSLLAGLACGLVTGLSAVEGLSAWPIVSWTRDLLAAGLLTTLLNGVIPRRPQ